MLASFNVGSCVCVIPLTTVILHLIAPWKFKSPNGNAAVCSALNSSDIAPRKSVFAAPNNKVPLDLLT